jgi:hypothetical protein
MPSKSLVQSRNDEGGDLLTFVLLGGVKFVSKLSVLVFVRNLIKLAPAGGTAAAIFFARTCRLKPLGWKRPGFT